MAKLHSASPREITSPFPHEIISNYTQKHVITYTNFFVFNLLSINRGVELVWTFVWAIVLLKLSPDKINSF